MFLKGSVLTNTKPWLVSGAIQLMTKKQYREGSASGHMAVAKSFHVRTWGVQWSMQDLISNILLV